MASQETFHVTIRPGGVAILSLALALFLFGLASVDGACMTVGVALAFVLWVAFLIARWNLHGIEIGIKFPDGVTTGRGFGLGFRLGIPHRRHDAFAIKADLTLAGLREEQVAIPWIAAGSDFRTELQISMPARGHFHSHVVSLSSCFPFGWFESERWIRLSEPILVKPRISAVPVQMEASGGGRAGLEPTAWQGSCVETGGDWRGLRAWRVGDSPKQIHWPCSLRQPPRMSAGEWLVRDEDPPGLAWDACLVVFHSVGNRGGLIRLDRFERALSLMAGIIRQVRRDGCRCRWTADFTGWNSHPADTTAEWESTLRSLARCERSTHTEWQDVVGAIQKAKTGEVVLVISDVAREEWIGKLVGGAKIHGFSPFGKARTTRLFHPR